MSDEELIARLRKADEYEPLGHDGWEAADRIEALVKERDQWIEHTKNAVWSDSEELKLANARAERLEAAVRVARVHVANNAEGWSVSRGAARDDLTIVDAALKGADHE